MSENPRCTIETRTGSFCDSPAIEWAPFPICARHAMRLYRVMEATMNAARSDPLLMASLALEEIDQRRQSRHPGRLRSSEPEPVVYFLLIDGLVKIGYASNLANRLAQYPPSAQLLATEPGDRIREAELHAEFAEYLIARREWFTPGPRLREYIDKLSADTP